jgi:D-sedoheptulose 7-phosphate isomerase
MQKYLSSYIKAQQEALGLISLPDVELIINKFHTAWKEDRQIFAFGNGGSAANASHFVTDLGKSASDAMGKPFRCMSLNDNVSWITAIGNDYAYDEVYQRQLVNFGRAGDILLLLSVSGSSPNLVTAAKWAKQQGLYIIALVGANRGALEQIADFLVVIDSKHYGRVEDAQMGICHMICYSFIEKQLSPSST